MDAKQLTAFAELADGIRLELPPNIFLETTLDQQGILVRFLNLRSGKRISHVFSWKSFEGMANFNLLVNLYKEFTRDTPV